MKLRPPPAVYSRAYEVERNRQLEQSAKRALREDRNVETQGDVIISSPNGVRWRITVGNDGTVSASKA